jgi:hypothetical protein
MDIVTLCDIRHLYAFGNCDQYYDFKNIFAEKFTEKMAFLSKKPNHANF